MKSQERDRHLTAEEEGGGGARLGGLGKSPGMRKRGALGLRRRGGARSPQSSRASRRRRPGQLLYFAPRGWCQTSDLQSAESTLALLEPLSLGCCVQRENKAGEAAHQQLRNLGPWGRRRLHTPPSPSCSPHQAGGPGPVGAAGWAGPADVEEGGRQG